MLGVDCDVRGSLACNLARDQQICRLGWLLLAMWLVMIIYMTKVFNFTLEFVKRVSCVFIHLNLGNVVQPFISGGTRT